MSIPLDRLYHYIESVAQEVYGNTVIYRFYPHGSKKPEDFTTLTKTDWLTEKVSPGIFCYDQEPLEFTEFFYPFDKEKFIRSCTNDCYQYAGRLVWLGVYDQAILLHSELRSSQVEILKNNHFLPVYYWSHGIIARDWFRYAEFDTKLNSAEQNTKFLIYNRAWSGTREYRLKFLDLLIEHELLPFCQTSCNTVEPELGIHYRNHAFKNLSWQPIHNLENYTNPTNFSSTASADYTTDDYANSEFEVVLETLFDDSRVHLTEKSLRPIACKKPFILMATHGSLEYLRNYGFKTFSDVIDESYDSIESPVERMKAVVDLMKTIASWTDSEHKLKYQKLQEIAEFNHKHFFSQEFSNLLANELKQNLSTALTYIEDTNTCELFFSLRKILFEHAPPDIIKHLKTSNNRRTRDDLASVLRLARTYQKRQRQNP